MCQYCRGEYGKDITIKESPCSKETQSDTAQIMKLPRDAPGIILYKNGVAQGYFDISYCPKCGQKID